MEEWGHFVAASWKIGNFDKWVVIWGVEVKDVGKVESKKISLKGAGASEAGGQTKEGPLSKRYFQTSKIAQNRTKSPVPIVIDVFGVTAPCGNPYGSKIAIVWLFFVIF